MSSVCLAQAAPVPFNEQQHDNAQVFRSLMWQTVDCMRQGAINQLRLAKMERDPLAQWLATTCGMQLGRHMVINMGADKRDVAEMLFNMGHAAINERLY